MIKSFLLNKFILETTFDLKNINGIIKIICESVQTTTLTLRWRQNFGVVFFSVVLFFGCAGVLVVVPRLL